MRIQRLRGLLVAGMATLALGCSQPEQLERGDLVVTLPDPPPPCPDLAAAIDPAEMAADLGALAAVATDHDGHRAALSPGYDASVALVLDQLERAGVAAQLHHFRIVKSESLGRGDLVALSGPPLGPAHLPAARSPPGDVTAKLVAIDPALGPGNESTSGCEPEDFGPATRGAIALIQRGGCPFIDKVRNAEAAGAVGVLIYNQGDQPARHGLMRIFLAGRGSDPRISIPVRTTTASIGQRLVARAETGVELRLVVESRQQSWPEVSVVAEIPGRSDQVLLVGAHLDSVPEGPGINDNGSGTVAVLAIARALAGCVPQRTIRFAWWGAEERGLIGSEAYVTDLSAAERARIAGYLNLDMVASVNHVFAVLDTEGADDEPAGSQRLRDFFREELTTAGEHWVDRRPEFRSDYTAFFDAGIAVGQLAAGFDEKKSAAEVRNFGGTAGRAHDPCYHRACDDLSNVDQQVLETITRATARAVQHFGVSGQPIR